MLEFLGYGIYGGPTCQEGAAQQEASAEHCRRQQEDMLNAYRPAPERAAETERYYATRRHVEALRAERDPDRWFWYYLAAMTAIAALWRIIQLH